MRRVADCPLRSFNASSKVIRRAVMVHVIPAAGAQLVVRKAASRRTVKRASSALMLLWGGDLFAYRQPLRRTCAGRIHEAIVVNRDRNPSAERCFPVRPKMQIWPASELE